MAAYSTILNDIGDISITSFKDEQKKVLDCAYTGDVIGVLPTGFGKTLIIQVQFKKKC